MPRTTAHPELIPLAASPRCAPAGSHSPVTRPAGTPSLRAVLDSFPAPGPFRALENYGADPEPEPTVGEVLEAGERAIAWCHAEIERGVPESLADALRNHIAFVRAEMAKVSPVLAAAE